MPDWKNAEIRQRLLTAIVASVDKLDVTRIAELYGDDVTRGSVEWQLRCIKKEAKQLRESAGGKSSKSSTSSKDGDETSSDKVKTGRVTKKKTAPKKKKSEETANDEAEEEKHVEVEEVAVKSED